MTADNQKKLKDYSELINNTLKTYCVKDNSNYLQSSVIDAMHYALEAGGKRIRPVLVMEFCRICGEDYKQAVATACALEMLHTFSLIHDDLPAMDDDDFRRGRPSCHRQYGEVAAILAGDALAILPFEVIAKDDRISDKQKVRLISELSYSSGVNGMIGGQIIDMENEQRELVDEKNLRQMYACKTGALIRLACRMGCIIAGADEKLISLADKYGEYLGLAFQVIDDILDVISTQELLGKPIGSDEAENKTTFVTLFGIAEAQKKAEIITNKALSILDNFDNNQFIKELTKELLIRKN